jgi:hypothetical protein
VSYWTKYQLSSQVTKEAFSNTIVPTVGFATHTAFHFVVFEQLLEIVPAVLAATFFWEEL